MNGEVSASKRFSSEARKRIADGGVRSLATVAFDPSVGDYADTSPYEWGGMLALQHARWGQAEQDGAADLVVRRMERGVGRGDVHVAGAAVDQAIAVDRGAARRGVDEVGRLHAGGQGVGAGEPH